MCGLVEESLRHRRSAEIVDNERPVHGQYVHSWAIVTSSVITIILLVLVSLLCIGGKKNKTEPSKLVIVFIIAIFIYLFVFKLLGHLLILSKRQVIKFVHSYHFKIFCRILLKMLPL